MRAWIWSSGPGVWYIGRKWTLFTKGPVWRWRLRPRRKPSKADIAFAEYHARRHGLPDEVSAQGEK